MEPEDILAYNYRRERDFMLDTDHPLAPHFTDSWRDTVRNIHGLYLAQKRIAEDWRKRVYSQNATMVDSYDPVSGMMVKRRMDECNELRRRRMIAKAEKQASILSGFAGNLLIRISPTPETREITKTFLKELNTNNTNNLKS